MSLLRVFVALTDFREYPLAQKAQIVHKRRAQNAQMGLACSLIGHTGNDPFVMSPPLAFGLSFFASLHTKKLPRSDVMKRVLNSNGIYFSLSPLPFLNFI